MLSCAWMPGVTPNNRNTNAKRALNLLKCTKEKIAGKRLNPQIDGAIVKEIKEMREEN